MAVTVLTLWNQAISSIKVGDTIYDEAEVSRSAEQCALFYETVRDTVFRAARWNCLTQFSRLATNATQDDDEWVAGDPPPPWQYAFALPTNCIRPRFLSSWGKFELTRNGSTPVIACNEATPILQYTEKVTTPALWDSDLFQAVMYALAAAISPGLGGNDSTLQNMFTLANDRVLAARATNGNISQNNFESLPDWIAARGGGFSVLNRYIFPDAAFTLSGITVVG